MAFSSILIFCEEVQKYETLLQKPYKLLQKKCLEPFLAIRGAPIIFFIFLYLLNKRHLRCPHFSYVLKALVTSMYVVLNFITL